MFDMGEFFFLLCSCNLQAVSLCLGNSFSQRKILGMTGSPLTLNNGDIQLGLLVPHICAFALCNALHFLVIELPS